MDLIFNSILFLSWWNPGTWAKDAIYYLFITLDQGLYSVVAMLWNWIFEKVISIVIFTDQDIINFTNRFYAIVGILVLFFVSYKIITYIVNPDVASDKSKGFGKIISRLFIGILLTIAIPLLFQRAMAFQGTVVKSGVLGKIITGAKAPVPETGDMFAGRIWIGFTSDTNQTDQAKYVDESLKANTTLNKLADSFLEDNISYSFILPTITAGIILYLLLTLMFDLIIRTLKLGLIQILAPVFIALYIIDDSGSKFNNWFKVTMSTYGMLFIKLIIIYFVGDWIPKIIQQSWVQGDIILSVIVIISLLYSVKIIPKFIAKLFNIDESLMTGDGAQLLKTAFSTAAGVGMAVATGGAAAVGGAAGAFAGAGGGLAGTGAAAKKLTTGAFSTASQGVKGGMAGYKNQGIVSPFTAGRKASQDHLDAKYKKQEARALGKPVSGSVRETFEKGKEAYETQSFNKANASEIKRAEEIKKANERLETDLRNKLRDSVPIIAAGGQAPIINVPDNKLSGVIEALRKQGLDNKKIEEYFTTGRTVIPIGVPDINGKVEKDEYDPITNKLEHKAEERVFDFNADSKLSQNRRTEINTAKVTLQADLDFANDARANLQNKLNEITGNIGTLTANYNTHLSASGKNTTEIEQMINEYRTGTLDIKTQSEPIQQAINTKIQLETQEQLQFDVQNEIDNKSTEVQTIAGKIVDNNKAETKNQKFLDRTGN